MRRSLFVPGILALLAISGFLLVRPSGGEVVRSNAEHDASPEATAAEIGEAVGGNTAFAFDLYQALREREGNLFFSPHSISVALAMTYAGARGETEQQMANVLHFGLAQDRLHQAFNALGLKLAARAGEGLELHIANAIWGQTGEPFLPEFLDTLAVNYDAGLRLVDFLSDAERARSTINEWVSEQTKGKIKDLITPDLMGRPTVLILTNAIYFDGTWQYQFKQTDTRKGEFTLLDGTPATVDMMSQTTELGYADVVDCQAVELPYQGGELSMLVLLPEKGGLQDFEGRLDAAEVQTIVALLQPTRVHLTMPKFNHESSFRLKDALSAMGMPDAFAGADFSGMNGKRDLSVSEVVHKAMVEVDEEGTVAAAATAVVMGRGLPLPPTEMAIDRPFIFLVRDVKSGAILFLGRVLDPRA